MKVETVTIAPSKSDQPAARPDAQVVMVEVSGPIDPNDAVIKRARELVVSTGSAEMIKSFDWALEHEALVTED